MSPSPVWLHAGICVQRFCPAHFAHFTPPCPLLSTPASTPRPHQTTRHHTLDGLQPPQPQPPPHSPASSLQHLPGPTLIPTFLLILANPSRLVRLLLRINSPLLHRGVNPPLTSVDPAIFPAIPSPRIPFSYRPHPRHGPSRRLRGRGTHNIPLLNPRPAPTATTTPVFPPPPPPTSRP